MKIERKLKALTIALAAANVLCAVGISSASAADLRSRNVIQFNGGSGSLSQSSNGTDVVNIVRPDANGVSHNIYGQFDIDGNVIFNNSTTDGASVIGSQVSANPNFDGATARTIITEITSGTASSMTGALEVFGTRADLIFANENGLTVNGMRFINASGVTLTTGRINDGKIDVATSGTVTIGPNGVMLDGDYFNVIARSMTLAGAVSSDTPDSVLGSIHLLAGLNTVDLTDPSAPRVTASRQGQDKPVVAVDGQALGSMYAGTIVFESTESGVGVRHQGVTTAVDDIEMLIAGALDNTGKLQSAGNLTVQAESLANSGVMHADKNATIAFDGLDNSGSITSSDTLALQYQTEAAVELDPGKVYADNLLQIDVKGDATVNETLENVGSLALTTGGALTVNETIAAGASLTIRADALDNRGYIYAGGDLAIDAQTSLTNAGGIESAGRMDLNAPQMTNSAYVSAGGDLYIETDNLRNLAELLGDVTVDGKNTIYSQGWTSWGDTAFKWWEFETTLVDVPTFANGLYLRQAVLQSGGDTYINNDSHNLNAQIVNQGKIIVGGDLKSWGDVGNETLYRSMSVIDILKSITLEDGVIGHEYLGSWNTNNSFHLTSGYSFDDLWKEMFGFEREPSAKATLYDLLVYFSPANTGIKDHQKEGAWNAVKNAAADNEALRTYLTLLFGAGYADEWIIPSMDKWNVDAQLVWTPAEQPTIAVQGSAAFEANSFTQGLAGGLDKNFTIVRDTIGGNLIDPDEIAERIEDIFKSGVFDLVINEDLAPDEDIHFEFGLEDNTAGAEADDSQYGFTYLYDQLRQHEQTQASLTEDLYRIVGDETLERLFLNQMLKADGDTRVELSDADMKALLDQAVIASSELGLQIGTALSAEQAASLKADTIWYVYSEVNGRNVLVPVLYEAPKSASIGGTVTAGGNLTVNAAATDSTLGSLSAQGDVALSGRDIALKGSTVSGRNVTVSGDSVSIESVTNNTADGQETIASSVSADNRTDIVATGDIVVAGSDVAGKDVTLSGQNVTITAAQEQSSSFTQQVGDNSLYNVSESSTALRGSSVTGDNVTIAADNTVDVTASAVASEAQDGSVAVSGRTVNIAAGYESAHEVVSESFSGVNGAGLGQFARSSASSSGTNAVASNVSSNGNLTITAQGDLTIAGSNLTAGRDAALSGQNIVVADAADKLTSVSDSMSYQVVGYQSQHVEHKSTTSVGSNIDVGGALTVTAQDKVSVIGSNMAAGGDLVLTADQTEFAAGKNTAETTSSSFGFGMMAEAAGEIGGYGGKASWSGITGQASTSVYEGSKTVTADGRRNNLIGYAQTGFEIAVSKSSESSTTYTMSGVSGGNIRINNEGKLDIGGVNMAAQGDIVANAGQIVSTKYVDETTSNSESYGVYVRQRVEATSPYAELINTVMEAAQADSDLNPAIVAAQLASLGVTMATSDLLTVISYQTIGISGGYSNAQTAVQQTGSLTAGGSLSLTAGKGDIELNGTNVQGKDVTLEAAGQVRLNAAENRQSNETDSWGANASHTQTSAYNAIDGGTAKFGLQLYADAKFKSDSSTTHTDATVTGERVSIKSGGDTTLAGARVTAGDVQLDVGGNLNVRTVADSSDRTVTGVVTTASGALGGSTNHIVTGSGMAGVTIQHEVESQTSVGSQTGIVATGSVGGTVGGDLNIKAGVIDAASGNIDVAGQVNAESVTTTHTQDGALVGGSLAFDGTPGAYAVVDISDHIDTGETYNTVVNVGINGSTDHGLKGDAANTVTGAWDNSWEGGTINLGPSIGLAKQKLTGGSSSGSSSSTTSGTTTQTPASLDTRL